MARGSIHKRLPLFAFAAAILLLVGAGALARASKEREATSERWVEHTHQVIHTLQRLRIGVEAAESSVRGFALAGPTAPLDEFGPALADAGEALHEVRRLTGDNPEQQARLDRLEPRVVRRMQIMRDLRDRVVSGSNARLAPEELEISDRIRALMSEMTRAEEELLGRRQADNEQQSQATFTSTWIILALAIALVLAATLLLNSESKRRSEAEQAITTKNQEQATLLRLTDLLQGCRSSDESYDVIGRLAPELFQSDAGAVYLFHASRNMLESCVTWGDEKLVGAPTLAPDDCWGLRRGQPYTVRDAMRDPPCRHLVTPAPAQSLCLPLMAHGEVTGLLFLASQHALGSISASRAQVVVEQLSMALANMLLRERLRDQSIRDPLTGLFNRRYTEETLERSYTEPSAKKLSSGCSQSTSTTSRRSTTPSAITLATTC